MTNNMIKGFFVTWSKKFDDEWYQKSTTCKAFEDLEKLIETTEGVYTFHVKVLKYSDNDK